MITNVGNQTVLWKYKYPATGSAWSKLITKILQHGIYNGGQLSNLGNAISVSNFDAVVNCVGSNHTVVIHSEEVAKISTDALNDSTNIPLGSITEAKPYIVANYTWGNVILNFLTWEFKAQSEITSTDIVFGRAEFTSGNVSGFNYDETTYGFYFNGRQIRIRNNIQAFTSNSGALVVEKGGIGAGGNIVTAKQLISEIVTGTAPMVVASQTNVTNLSADMIDNIHIQDIPYLGQPPTIRKYIRSWTGDADTINAMGKYYNDNNSITNCPFANGSLIHYEMLNTSDVTQRFYGIDGSEYKRIKSAGVWGSWFQIVNANGKTTNADLLDGHDTNFFTPATHPCNSFAYVNNRICIDGGTNNAYVYNADRLATLEIGTAANRIAYIDSSGTLASPIINATSHSSLKQNIKEYTDSALKVLNEIKVYSFQFKENPTNDRIGIIADWTGNKLVSTGKEQDLSNTVNLLLKAVQELSAKVEELEKKVVK